MISTLNPVTSSDSNSHTDIIVVGGGVVGALLCQALLHAKLGLHITLITTNATHTAVYADDIRALALSHHTLSQLELSLIHI